MSNNKRYATIWFKQAQYDLNAAEISLKSGSYEWACYQSQQAAEKALKSFLYFNRKRDITIHSIRK